MTGFLLFRYFPNARGSGIPQTKVALFLRDGFISFRTVLGKFGLCSVSLASGIALGREGPSVHVGAGIASSLGRRLGLSPTSVKALVPAGASAALAAAFNTPISAVLFSLEEVMGDLNAPVLGSIVLSSAASWIVLHMILGDEPLFHVPAYQLVHPVEFLVYAALGVLGGLVSVSFVKLLLWQRKHFLRAPASMQWFLPGVGGLTVGLLGWFFPEVLGVGYAFVGRALNGQMLAGAMALLVLLKIVATATCYASGNAGGIFGPSLFMGAMMGGAVGGVAHMLMPDYTGSAGAYALVGMGAAFAGIVRVPLTSVIMVFEITRDYSIVVPLMIANLISYFISSKLQKEPIYEALQHQDGIHLPSGARARESLMLVGHAYRPQSQILSASELVGQAAASVDRQCAAWAVVDPGGFRGMVTLDELDDAVRNGHSDATLAQLLPELGPLDRSAGATSPRVYTDDPLETAMRWLAGGKVKVLPVVSRTDVRDVRGTISLPDVLAAYSAARSEPEGESVGDAPSGKYPTTLLAGALAALIGVAILGGFLNYFYRVERGRRAEHAYQAGNQLFRSDRLPEAIQEFRNALSISHKVEHRLALGLALVQADRLNEASIYLNEVLREQPHDGPANLAMATVTARTGRADDAVLYYRRAIAGSWPGNPAQGRTEARIELVEFLGKSAKPAQARAELLSLAAELPPDPALQRRVARMLMDFGQPGPAADEFRRLIQEGSPDATEYDGLGEAELALAHYRSARDAFRHALAFDAGDQLATRRAELCDRILDLDPMQRGLNSKERFQRSHAVLNGVLAQLLACAGSESALPGSSKDLVVSARAELARKRPASYSDAAEANETLAGKLWSERPPSCSVSADTPLARVLARLSAR